MDAITKAPITFSEPQFPARQNAYRRLALAILGADVAHLTTLLQRQRMSKLPPVQLLATTARAA